MSTPQVAPLPHEWSKAAFLSKATRYVGEMQGFAHGDWRHGLWASLALEMVIRAALSAVSPTLIADPKDSNNLLFALGREPKVSRFRPKSVEITSAVRLLQDILPGFNKDLADSCIIQLGLRNDEVHSGATPFDGIASAKWMPPFYEASKVLLESIGESLESLFGVEEATAAEQMIAAARDESAKSVLKTVQARKVLWEATPKGEQERLALQSSTWAARHAGHREKCPACGSDGLLTGEPSSAPVRRLEGDSIIETQIFLPSAFECIACGLKIGSLSQLHAVGLSASFKATSTFDAVDYFAPFDPQAIYEPDFNEP
jgi:hypothetical protein